MDMLVYLVTYQSGNSSSQLDYVLVRQSNRKMVNDVKVVAGEECAPQHNFVVCDPIIVSAKGANRTFVPTRRIWELKEDATEEKLSEGVSSGSF